MRTATFAATALFFVTQSALAQIEVGPGKAYTQLSDVAPDLVPGDLVLVDGDTTYDPVVFDVDGDAGNVITIRGVTISGNRPVISGGTRAVELAGDHYVFENFEVTGGSSSCLFHHADDITVRGVVIHGCPSHGLLGADDDSGSLLLEYSEVYATGEGTQHHQIYMATDEDAYPGSVFRMQHCYVHDSTGGNSVKSRAERAEIYYNWIEGARYHELELIGPDEGSASPPDPLKAREDSDVVGNVLRKAGTWTSGYTVRIGSDMLASDVANSTRGRYRFLNNTIILGADSSSVFRLFGLLESVEMHNNAIYRAGGGSVTLTREDDTEMAWVSGRHVAGSKNWVPEGTTDVSGWTGTIFGTDPAFADLAGFDIMPQETSPLREVANESPMADSGHDFPNPLALPVYLPPAHVLEAIDTARLRPVDDALDIGASEFGEIPAGGAPGAGGESSGTGGTGGSSSSGGTAGSATASGGSSGGSMTSGGTSATSGGTAGVSSAGTSSAGSSGKSGAGMDDSASKDSGGCGCKLDGRDQPSTVSGWIAFLLLLAARRRRTQRGGSIFSWATLRLRRPSSTLSR